MTKEQVIQLLENGKFPEAGVNRELIETHISWVILGERFAYKIKKPVHYNFLDFSTMEKRAFYCHREIELNRRLTDQVYLDVQSIYQSGNQFSLGVPGDELIDHAVRMNKLDRSRQMDQLLAANKVSHGDIYELASKIASFHKSTTVIYNKDPTDVREKFNDLGGEKDFLEANLGSAAGRLITESLAIANEFILSHGELLAHRMQKGYWRDCHGDLHSRNIFLLAHPQPFDCIEFNDDFRQIDVLNEIAFLCMDLDAWGRKDLSDLFAIYYNQLFPAMNTPGDQQLFAYYKSYRANVRAKVNSLRAKTANNNAEKATVLEAAQKYLRLMYSYFENHGFTH